MRCRHDFGADLPDGPPYQPWAAALVKERKAALGKDDPVAACRPGGAMRILTLNQVFEPDTELLDYHCMDVYLHDAERH